MGSVLSKRSQHLEGALVGHLSAQERQIIVRVGWTDDNGKVQVNRRRRVKLNVASGPTKELRLHRSVSELYRHLRAGLQTC
jgi:glutamate dehydrogenase (NADP+)